MVGCSRNTRFLAELPQVRLVIAALAFGVLIFFASSAALALEPPPRGAGVGHLSLLMLATLQALTGVIAIGGAAPFVERRWGTIIGCATASVTASAVTIVAAMHLASKSPLHLSPDGAALLLAIARLAGAGLLVERAYDAFGDMRDTSSKKSRPE
jgi:hypothetical protein